MFSFTKTYLRIGKSKLTKGVLFACLFSGTVCAQDTLKVITSGGFANTHNQTFHLFEKEKNVKVHTEYGSSSGGAADSIPERLKRGEQFDVIMLSSSSLSNLSDAGYVLDGSQQHLVKSQIGMAVKDGAPKPDISTPEAFVNTLKNAKSIGYSASASGTYLSTKLWPKMGIWSEIEPKSQRILSKRVASVVADGDVEIGFQQISEILPIEGATLVGPIPDEYQKITIFSAGILKTSEKAELAQSFIDFIRSQKVREAARANGLIPYDDEQE